MLTFSLFLSKATAEAPKRQLEETGDSEDDDEEEEVENDDDEEVEGMGEGDNEID